MIKECACRPQLIKFCIIRVFWIGDPNEGYDEDSSRNVQLHAGDEYHVKAGEDLSKPIIRAYVGLKNVALLTLFLSLQFPSWQINPENDPQSKMNKKKTS